MKLMTVKINVGLSTAEQMMRALQPLIESKQVHNEIGMIVAVADVLF